LDALLLWLLLLDLLSALRLLLQSLLASLLRLLLPSLLCLMLLRLLLPRLLGPLLLCGWRRTLPLPTLLLFGLALFFLLLVVLRVCRDDRSAKQKQGSGTGSSNKLHRNRLLQGRRWICTQTTSPFEPHRFPSPMNSLPFSVPSSCLCTGRVNRRSPQRCGDIG
jgi:hypothetical protein